MNFIVLTLLLGVLVIASSFRNNKKIEFMSKEFTTAIKGFVIISVIWAHSSARLGVGGIQFIAGIGVALFLICSGYGLEISYQNRGLKSFWKNRVLKLCIPYWLVSLISAVVEHTINKEKIIDILLFQEGGWFIKYIIVCYVLFYINKKISNKSGIKKPWDLVIMGCFYVIWFAVDTVYFANPNAPFLAARQMGSFVFGMVIARYRNRVYSIMSKKRYILMGEVQELYLW